MVKFESCDVGIFFPAKKQGTTSFGIPSPVRNASVIIGASRECFIEWEYPLEEINYIETYKVSSSAEKFEKSDPVFFDLFGKSVFVFGKL